MNVDVLCAFYKSNDSNEVLVLLRTTLIPKTPEAIPGGYKYGTTSEALFGHHGSGAFFRWRI